MLTLHTPEGAKYLLQALVSAFLAILFLQAGLDKIVDRHGNMEWLTGHFAKSALAGMVPFLLTVLTFLEIAAGALCGVGTVLVLFRQGSIVAFFGALLSALSLLALFLGQRMARDYAGAGSLVPYFLLALVSLYLLA